MALGLTAALSGCSFILDFGGEVEGRSDAAPDQEDAAPAADGAPGAFDAGLDAAVLDVGCADGQREGFVDLQGEPDIAACGGAFAVGGVITVAEPGCGRGAGDDGVNAAGTGCNVTDLCAVGWHVCATPAEVAAASFFGTCASAVVGEAAVFYVTRQSGAGGGECGAGANDLFGCGNQGSATAASCSPLDRFSGDLCAALATGGWSCGADGTNEAGAVTKTAADGGGVLCCRDGA